MGSIVISENVLLNMLGTLIQDGTALCKRRVAHTLHNLFYFPKSLGEHYSKQTCVTLLIKLFDQ